MPSVMGAARLTVSARERLMTTIVLAPFMSCGARGDFRRLLLFHLLRAKRRAGGLLAVRAGYCRQRY